MATFAPNDDDCINCLETNENCNCGCYISRKEFDEMQFPKHGQTRNHRREMSQSSSSCSSYPVHEQYCSACGAWKTMTGLIGIFMSVGNCPDCQTPWEMKRD